MAADFSQTPYGTLIKLSKLRFYVSAAIPYNKPVYFEAAMERWVEGGGWEIPVMPARGYARALPWYVVARTLACPAPGPTHTLPVAGPYQQHDGALPKIPLHRLSTASTVAIPSIDAFAPRPHTSTALHPTRHGWSGTSLALVKCGCP